MASKSAQPDSAFDTEEALDYIDKTMERLKSLYEQFFLGMQKQPPTHLHNDVERRIRDLMQVQIRNTGLRYRFATLQQKFGSYSSYWRRTLRQIEQGRDLRQLSRISRKAAQTGEEIPEEILAAMPKRMREQVKRDREQALALQARRAAAAGEHVAEDTMDQGEDAPAIISETVAVRNAVRKNQHSLSESDGDMDFDAFFASMSDKSDDTNPDAKPYPSAAGDEDEATSFSDGPPAFMPPPRAAAPVSQAQRASGPLPQGPPQHASAPLPQGPPQHPSGPLPQGPPQRATGPIQQVPPQRATGPVPAVSPQRATGPVPAVSPQRATGPVPAVPPQRATGPVPAVPPQRASGPIQQGPPQRATGPVPAIPPQRASEPIPTVPPPRASGPIPSVPRATSQPPPPPPRSATQPPAPPASQSAKFVAPQRVGTQQGVPPAPTQPNRQTGPVPIVAQARPAAAPSQVTRPNPIQPGASQQRPQVPVESMQGPFPRQPTNQQPGPPARPTPRPEPAPPMRPPPGMNDADVNALYAKYVNAKKAVGDDPGPGAYGRLLKTINAQAPKIMEQYKASGVEFSIVVKDNQVIIKAKPKP